MRYFFEIAYKGTNYHGWQRQKNAISVQQVIEEKLTSLYSGKSIAITGCGRTDTGVHARKFFFHVDLDAIDKNKLMFQLNNMLPVDICILNIHLVNDSAHARFDADCRTYRYYIHTKKDPFVNSSSLYCNQSINIEDMNKSCAFFLGNQDFTSFSKLHTDVKTNFCVISSIQWKSLKQGRIVFEISANRFLRNMVRAIVGTMLEIGTGKIKPESVVDIINAKDRSLAGYSVSAHGLFLENVSYPYINSIN